MIFTLPTDMMNRHIDVTVIGCGGTGSYLLSLLAQMNYLLRNISDDVCGIQVTAFDPSRVNETNCGRQNFWPCDINKYKSHVLIDRLNMGFATQWTSVHASTTTIPHNCDVVMTCVDTIASRIALGRRYKHRDSECLWIDGGNDDHSGNIIFGHLGLPEADVRLPNWYDLYARTMKDLPDDDTKSCSHLMSITRQDFGVNHQCALIMARSLWRLVRHGKTTQGMHYFDVKDESIQSMKLNPSLWAMFDYENKRAIG